MTDKSNKLNQAPIQERAPENIEQVIELITQDSKEISLWPEELKGIKFNDLVLEIESKSNVERDKIVEGILTRYYGEISLKDSNVLVTAVHSVLPEPKEVALTIGQYKEFENIPKETILKKQKEVLGSLKDDGYPESSDFKSARKKVGVGYKGEIDEAVQDLRKMTGKGLESDDNEGGEVAVNALEQMILNNKLKLTLLKIMAGSDALAGKFAKDVAGSELSLALPVFSRRTVDSNKELGNRSLIPGGKITRMEFGHGAALAQWYLMRKLVSGAEGIDQIYHLNILERDDDKPITIALAEIDGKLPCDKGVAKVLMEKISEKMKERDIEKTDGSNYHIEIAKKGAFSGKKSPVNINRRWGKGDFNGIGLNDSYQHVQMGIPSELIRTYGKKMTKIIQEAITEISKPKENSDL